jgi:RHS repeat-associated protein
MMMPGRNYSAASGYRYGFNGKERDKDINIGAIAFEARIYDSRVGKMFSTDSRQAEYAWQSTYAYYKNSPINVIDVKGRGGTSTHLDPSGKVIAVYNDGDNSIYKHQTAKTKEEVDKWRKKFSNNSGNGVKVGETLYWYDFMNTDEKKGTLTNPMVGSAIDNVLCFTKEEYNKAFQEKGNQDSYCYGSAKLLLDELKADFGKIMDKKSNTWIPINGKSDLKAYKQLEALKDLSGNDDPYDIKSTLLKPNEGYLYEVRNGVSIYTTGRALGNILFGANVREVYNDQASFGVVKAKFTSGEFFDKIWESKVGPYNLRNHTSEEKKNFPMQFFGEHPYSGSFQYLGYFNSTSAGF